MKIWKIASGILSILISLFVAFQSFFAGLFNAAASNGQSSGTAGMVVAVLLFIAGIVAVATCGGSRGGDIAMAVLYGIGTIVGFFGAGGYADLYIWALWCLLSAFLALLDFALLGQYGDDEEDDDEEDDEPEEDAVRTPVAFRAVILETDPKRRDAVIDALPEREAKNYLKQALNVLVPRQAARSSDGNDGVVRILIAVLAVLGIFIVGVVAFGIVSSVLSDRQAAQSHPPAASAPAESPQPAQTPGLANAAQQSERYGVGGQVTSDGVTVTLLSVTESQGSGLLVPGEGKTFILCEFDIENNSDSDITVSSILSFSAYVDDYTTGLNISAVSSADKPQLDGTIAAGKKMNGVIGYEAAADWSEIEIRFIPDFWSRKNIAFAYEK